MKKILLFSFLVLCTLVCNAQKKKSFYYDGIEIHNVKGWTIAPSKDANVTTITFVLLPSQLQIKKQGLPQNFNATRYLEKTVEQLMEMNVRASRKDPKIKAVGEVSDGYINSIPAKYVDITYSKDIVKRIYTFSMHDQLFIVQWTGEGTINKVAKVFDKMLSTFTYNPERSPYGSLM